MHKQLILVPLISLTIFIAGFGTSIQKHGDWILVRDGGRCAALDPNKRREVGQWPVGDDGRCHMSAFIWSKTFMPIYWRWSLLRSRW